MSTENPMKMARLALGLTQVQMAEALEVSQPTISAMESDADKIDRRTMLAIEALKHQAASALDQALQRTA
jgi:DNA-binding XRE family transcriptional regulator